MCQAMIPQQLLLLLIVCSSKFAVSWPNDTNSKNFNQMRRQSSWNGNSLSTKDIESGINHYALLESVKNSGTILSGAMGTFDVYGLRNSYAQTTTSKICVINQQGDNYGSQNAAIAGWIVSPSHYGDSKTHFLQNGRLMGIGRLDAITWSVMVLCLLKMPLSLQETLKIVKMGNSRSQFKYSRRKMMVTGGCILVMIMRTLEPLDFGLNIFLARNVNDTISSSSKEVDHTEAQPTVEKVYKAKNVAPSENQQGDAGANLVAKGKSKQDKILCFKCGLTGHVGNDCTVKLCVFCDSALHADEACPLPKLAKPTAVLYGMARESLMYFKVPKSENVRLKNESGKVGRIRVAGGKLTVPQVLKELEWLVPGNPAWEIYPAGETDFRVIFPTKADLTRLKRIKFIEVEGSEMAMYFEDWTAKSFDKWGLYDVWVRISGCPEPLCRDYLALFAVGSLVGETKEVDMKFTREHGVVRQRIACANPEQIPRTLDFMYEGEGFGVQFDIEAEDGTLVAAGDFMLHDPDADKDQEGKNNDESSKNNQPEKSTDMNQGESAKGKETKATGSSEHMETDDAAAEIVDSNSNDEVVQSTPNHRIHTLPPKIASEPSKRWYQMVEEEEEELARSLPLCKTGKDIVAPMTHTAARLTQGTHDFMSPGRQLDTLQLVQPQPDLEGECAEKGTQSVSIGMLGSPVDSVVHAPLHQVEHTQGGDDNGSEKETECSHGGTFDTAAQAPLHQVERSIASMSPQRVDQGKEVGTGVFLGGRYSKAEVIKFGGLSEQSQLGVRSSARIKAQPNADATQMERASLRAQVKNFDFSGYAYDYSLDKIMVLSPTGRATPCYGVWMYPVGICHQGPIQPLGMVC